MSSRPLDLTASRIQLIVCADDFGLTDGINDAVLKLARSGRVSGVGALVDGPAWRAGAPFLGELDADVGLHLNFTEQLAGSSPVYPLPGLIARAYSGLLDHRQVRKAIESQLDRFESSLGRCPDYVDGHQHVHQFPVIREALLSTLVQRYQRAPWIRSTARPPATQAWRGHADHRKAWVIDALGGRALRHAATRLGVAMNRRLLGVYDFGPSAEPYGARVSRWLDGAGDHDVLMCHPASSTESTDPIGELGCCRFRRHLVKVEDGTGGGLWERDGSSAGSSSLRR